MAKTKEQVQLNIAHIRNILHKNTVLLIHAWDKYINLTSRPDSSASTLRGHKSAYNRFLGWVGDNYPMLKNIDQISDIIATEYANWLWKPKLNTSYKARQSTKIQLSPRTYNLHIKSLSLIFKNLNNHVDPFRKENIRRKNEQRLSKKMFSKEEFRMIFEIFDSELNILFKDEMRVLFYIGACTGLRLIDCCLLKWDEVLIDERIIRRIPEKTKNSTNKKMAVIPVPRKLEDELNFAGTIKKSEYVLPCVSERYLKNPYGVRKDVIKIMRLAGIKTTEYVKNRRAINRYGFHTFRHTYASIMARKGYNISMLAKIMADNIKTLEQYYIDIDEAFIKNTFDNFILPLNTQADISDNKGKVLSLLNKLSSSEVAKVLDFIENEIICNQI